MTENLIWLARALEFLAAYYRSADGVVSQTLDSIVASCRTRVSDVNYRIAVADVIGQQRPACRTVIAIDDVLFAVACVGHRFVLLDEDGLRHGDDECEQKELHDRLAKESVALG